MTAPTFEARAREELGWLYAQAEADACGLKAVTWNVLEIVDPSKGSSSGSPGARRGAPPSVDPYPEHSGPERRRLRVVQAALTAVSHPSQAVLEAYFTPRGTAPGRGSHALGAEWSPVAALLPEVVSRAHRARRERMVQVRLLVAKEGSDHVRACCEALLERALSEYVRARFPQAELARRAACRRP